MERNPDGTFRRGHKGMGGRPRNSFSVTAALERMSAEAESVDDDGTVITRAALAARWLWKCVGSGTDRGHMLTFKERLDGFIAIRRAIEPDDRRESAGQGDDRTQNLSALTDAELAQLEALLSKATAAG